MRLEKTRQMGGSKMRIGTKEFYVEHKTYVMGILNVTPDSFSDGGNYNQLDTALRHTQEMIEAGVAIIDVGGESTRPGYTQISDEEEIERTAPVIEAIKKNFDIPVSSDTYKSKVALATAQAGADLINDIWGLKYDHNMAKVIHDTNTVCCLMHNRVNKDYQNFMKDMKQDMKETIYIAKEANIEDDKIILDPGVGFAKSYENNLEVIREVGQLLKLGYPILIGTSRKSVIGLTLNLPSIERMEGTLATTVMAVEKHCAFVRVHDVKENVRVIKMTEAIMNV